MRWYSESSSSLVFQEICLWCPWVLFTMLQLVKGLAYDVVRVPLSLSAGRRHVLGTDKSRDDTRHAPIGTSFSLPITFLFSSPLVSVSKIDVSMAFHRQLVLDSQPLCSFFNTAKKGSV
ncbi:hypothetical protein F5883DRAFT_180123 [Diaporthe sp. PMI_573]|nr:hypothetical protein F5883DRAFT_180123 [Diaporthaceae sp. PMI_573]